MNRIKIIVIYTLLIVTPFLFIKQSGLQKQEIVSFSPSSLQASVSMSDVVTVKYHETLKEGYIIVNDCYGKQEDDANKEGTVFIPKYETVNIVAVNNFGDCQIEYNGVLLYIDGDCITDDLEVFNEIKRQTYNSDWNGKILNRVLGRINGPSGQETYYNLNMNGVIAIMRRMGNQDKYWVREDGVKMLGDYVMVAANLKLRPRGSLIETSLGMGIVCDTGGFAQVNPTQLDIAVAW